MRYAASVFVKLIQALNARRKPSAEVAQRAFERAAERFNAL